MLNEDAIIIPISVRWLDGEDINSREAVEVGLYASHDIMVGGMTIYHKDELICTIALNARNSWHVEVALPLPAADIDVTNDFYITERSTYNDGDSDKPGSSGNSGGGIDASGNSEVVSPVGTSDKPTGSESVAVKQVTTPETGDNSPACMLAFFSFVTFAVSFSYLIARRLRKSEW